MTLVSVDLPAPAELGRRWAVAAAVQAAVGFGTHCHAAGPVWHYDDGGGNWTDLHLLGGGRAVLLGNDHEYSETYFRGAAEYFDEEETDLLAGAPAWWDVLANYADDDWVGFIYGFDGATWSRADHDLDDGFASIGLPAVSDELLIASVDEAATGLNTDAGLTHTTDPAAVLGASAAGAQLTREQAAGLLGAAGGDLDAAVAAARAFAPSLGSPA